MPDPGPALAGPRTWGTAEPARAADDAPAGATGAAAGTAPAGASAAPSGSAGTLATHLANRGGAMILEHARASTLLPARPRVQASLRVGAVDDPLEREAEAVADRVLRMPDPTPALTGGPPKEDIVRRCPGRCPPEGCEDEVVHRQRVSGGTPPALSGETAAAVRARRGAGQPLAAAVRSFFEPRLGAGLGRVRVHTHEGAAALSRRLGARAFTVGDDVFFGAGEYAPATPSGRRLLAHELIHTLQQRPAVLRQPQNPSSPRLQDCRALGHGADLEAAVNAAAALARDCATALDGVLDSWGADTEDPAVLAGRNALARGFNIEADKRLWVDLLGMDAAEVAQRDRRERAVATSVRDRFREIAADAPGYVGAPACRTRMTSGQRCFGCVSEEHPRCRRGVTAFVPPPFIGHPSSAILVCPRFFTGDTDRPIVVIHELAHLQTFAATDTHAGTRYYGCPVAPVDDWGRPLPGPGLVDPAEISGIADAYACFAETFRSAEPAHRRAAELQRQAREAVREALGTP